MYFIQTLTLSIIVFYYQLLTIEGHHSTSPIHNNTDYHGNHTDYHGNHTIYCDYTSSSSSTSNGGVSQSVSQLAGTGVLIYMTRKQLYCTQHQQQDTHSLLQWVCTNSNSSDYTHVVPQGTMAGPWGQAVATIDHGWSLRASSYHSWSIEDVKPLSRDYPLLASGGWFLITHCPRWRIAITNLLLSSKTTLRQRTIARCPLNH